VPPCGCQAYPLRAPGTQPPIGVGAPVVGPEEGMMEIVILLLMLAVLLDIAALKWGVNSVDDIDSPEWERRQRWYGFH
jgi:hypothetical protein